MANVGIPGEEDCYELDMHRLCTIDDLTPNDWARLRNRIEHLTRQGVIKPNLFDPLDGNRRLRWPQPVPRDARSL